MRGEWVERLDRRPEIVVYVLLSVQLIVWTLIPFLVNKSLPLDVTREGLSWGHEFQWGYYKHPPLASWCVEVFFRIFGDFGPYLLSQLCVCATIWLIFCLGRRIFDPRRAAIGAVLLAGLYYFSWPTPEFNHNVAQMPFWAASLLLFHRCLNERRARDWIVLGVIAGLALLTKYVFGVLLVMMALFVVLTPRHRRLLWSPWPYLSALIALIVLTPHLLWLAHHDFASLHYLNERAKAVPGVLNQALAPLQFLGAQVEDHLPMLLMLALPGAIVFSRHRLKSAADAENTRFLWLFGFGPALLTVAMGVVTARAPRDMWGAPMWNLSGVLVAAFLPEAILPQACRRLGLRAVILTSVVAIGYGAAAEAGGGRRPQRTAWPDRVLASALEAQWNAATGCPLRIIAGENWLGGLVAERASQRPSLLIDGRRDLSPWIDDRRLAAQGVLVIWQITDKASPASPFPAPFAGPSQGLITTPWPRNPKLKPLRVAYAILPPNAGCRPGR